ncbi:TetR/AcrR family transcriptional regulator [Mycoplasmatota bacterium]|nr:TetR/AcrR family transcriptional regulator [Mycoplasmatota bacterium]
MPSKTFFNLKPHKKQMIIDSAIEEFDLYTLKGAKVVRIIKRVNISRASFYKYFECIDELYYYILEKVADGVINIFKNELISSSGEFFSSIQNTFIEFVRSPETYTNSVSRIFNIDFSESYLYAKRYTNNLVKKISDIFNLVDTTKVRLEKPEDILDLFNLIISAVERIIAFIKVDFYSIEEALEVYNKRINILKYGVSIKQ